MACTKVTGKQLLLIHCQIAFESPQIARFVMNIEKNCKPHNREHLHEMDCDMTLTTRY